jgi:hypothetical protein
MMLQRLTALAAIVAATLLLTACERKITRVEVTEGPQTCFSCHSDQNTFLVAADQQWQNSRHASGTLINENDGQCKNCHTSEAYVARAATCTPFTTSDNSVVENPTTIHCFTCHAPHTDGDFRLRWTCSTTLQDGTTYDLHKGNLCASCHQARRDVNTYITASTTLSTRWGPHHSVQGDMLIGSNGYEYAAYAYEQTNHAGATTNNGGNGCVECHMFPATNNVVGGHTWNMAHDLGTEEILNTGACEACHGAIGDFSEVQLNGSSVQDSVVTLLGDLKTRLIAANLLGSTNDLPVARATSADSAGAVWNYLVIEADRSEGVHNAKYILGLLTSSIAYLDGTLARTTPLASAHVPRK